MLAAGETYSVREFVELAFAQIGHRIEWRGRVSTNRTSMRTVATSSSPLSGIFPADVDRLLGDLSKVQQRLGWRHKIEFADLAREMVEDAPALLGTEGRLYNRSG